MNRKTLRLYWAVVSRHKLSFVLMLIFIPAGVLLIDTILPYFFSEAIGALSEMNRDTTVRNLIAGAVVGLLGVLCNFVGFQSMVRHESAVQSELRNQTFRKLIHKDYRFFATQKIGAMTSRYIDFVRSHVTIQDLLIIRTLGFVLSVVIGLFIIGSQSLVAAGVVLALIIALIFEVRWSAKKRKPWRHERKTLQADINGVVADALTNSTVVKTFAAEDRETSNLEKLTGRFRKIFVKDIGFLAAEGSVRIFVSVAAQVLAIGFVAMSVLNGQMMIATAVFMLAYLQRIGSQIFMLGDMMFGYDQAFLDAQPMTEMLGIQDEVVDAKNLDKLTKARGEIAFDNVTFRYDDGNTDAINRLNIDIKKGQKVGLVGRSGAGKTTVAQLLLRLFDVTNGRILLDGADIRQISQRDLRSNIAYVPQDPSLFHRTIGENIAYGRPGTMAADIRDAARKAQALEFIEALPKGFDTIVGERGVKLSGGQRQRVAIARAILRDAPVLVLDEATSALDSESEVAIQSALDKLMRGRTSIVVAHRLSTIAKMDRILVLDNGRLIEDGSHDELLQRGGVYAKLWAHQSGGFIDE